MPAGPAPAWRARAPHTVEMIPVVAAVMAQLGYEREAVYGGIEGQARALDLRRGVFNAAKVHGVAVSASVESAGQGKWRIRFTLYDKRRARAHIVAKHGTDRTAWPYDTRRKRG